MNNLMYYKKNDNARKFFSKILVRKQTLFSILLGLLAFVAWYNTEC